VGKRKAERLIVIDIDVAVQRRRDFALNRHLYIYFIHSCLMSDAVPI
jgi:hypothetical protein